MICPEPAAESGCAVVDDYPRVGKCYFTGTMPCDGAISQTNILTRHFKELPSFQITPPQRVNEPEVQTYAVKNLKKGIEFLEQQFGVKWDWDAFWKNAEMYNESSRCMIEKWDVNCPSTHRSAVRRCHCSANMSSWRQPAWTSSCSRRTAASRR